ncbi:MAG TPA: diacylglycerol kinase family protein [bacterium]|nr:diacylglycerol kinase family protein [bacterium]HNT66506.1 diacylglycerol kinase family protein [bacterium]
MQNRIDIRTRLSSFKYAGRGFLQMLCSQQNAWIHALATVAVIAAGFWTGLDAVEWCLIVLAIVLVWMAESFNTALEFLADAAMPQYHPLIGKAKDVAAGAVLIVSLGAVVIAGLVFIPYFCQ